MQNTLNLHETNDGNERWFLHRNCEPLIILILVLLQHFFVILL